MADKTINLTLKIWRQKNEDDVGKMETYQLDKVSTSVSFLEMLDQLNEQLLKQKIEPVAFDHDCREGICGTCGAMINGQAHGPLPGVTLCQLHMRNFKNNDVIVIEPFRARAFPVVRDLVVDRSALDDVIQSGGYVSVKTGSAPDANAIPINKLDSDKAFDAAACIGCGACVAACPNASASLFTSAKITHLALLPQGKVERKRRVKSMVKKMDEAGFGYCSNHYECEAACPKEISVECISTMNRETNRCC